LDNSYYFSASQMKIPTESPAKPVFRVGYSTGHDPRLRPQHDTLPLDGG
jgi:hypothetical protein